MTTTLPTLPKASENTTSVEDFRDFIAAACPQASIQVEAGGEKLGNVWFDVVAKGKRVTAEWRPEAGVGIYHPGSDAYGTSPQEIYRNFPMAAKRIGQLLNPGKAKPLRLLRDLVELSQQDVAVKLRVKQAAVSRLERRENLNLKLHKLTQIVRALGGEIEVRVHLHGGELPILLPSSKERRRPTKKRKEFVHA